MFYICSLNVWNEWCMLLDAYARKITLYYDLNSEDLGHERKIKKGYLNQARDCRRNAV